MSEYTLFQGEMDLALRSRPAGDVHVKVPARNKEKYSGWVVVKADSWEAESVLQSFEENVLTGDDIRDRSGDDTWLIDVAMSYRLRRYCIEAGLSVCVDQRILSAESEIRN